MRIKEGEREKEGGREEGGREREKEGGREEGGRGKREDLLV